MMEFSQVQQSSSFKLEKIRNSKNPVFLVSVLRVWHVLGELLKRMWWSDPPLTKFRLNNMLTGAHYPIEKTQKIVGELPYSLNERVLKTLDWMYEEKLISFKNS